MAWKTIAEESPKEFDSIILLTHHKTEETGLACIDIYGVVRDNGEGKLELRVNEFDSDGYHNVVYWEIHKEDKWLKLPITRQEIADEAFSMNP